MKSSSTTTTMHFDSKLKYNFKIWLYAYRLSIKKNNSRIDLPRTFKKPSKFSFFSRTYVPLMVILKEKWKLKKREVLVALGGVNTFCVNWSQAVRFYILLSKCLVTRYTKNKKTKQFSYLSVCVDHCLFRVRD